MSTAIKPNTTTETETKEKVNYLKKYKVLMQNDPKTTMDFVIEVLAKFYEKSPLQAIKLTMDIHNHGSGLAGVYSYEGAEFRVDQTHSLARTRGFPLTCVIEEE